MWRVAAVVGFLVALIVYVAWLWALWWWGP
jgi:hypothetical protein